MIEIGTILANGCVTGETKACLVLSILGIVCIVGGVNIIIALFGRAHEEEKKS